jgi:DNA-binding NarL/FixJ family response regulator
MTASATNPTRIVIADDHPLLRSGLKQAIDAEPSMRVVGEAADGTAALDAIAALAPDIVVLDLTMPGMSGFEVITAMQRRQLRGDVIVLTLHNEEAMLARALSLGVRGYVLKNTASTDIVHCIDAVRRGQRYTSAEVTTYLFKRATETKPVEGLESLTPTERTVLRLIAEYKTSREIAADLGISHRTVENHRNNISAKLGVRGSHALVKFALRHTLDI